MISRGPFVCIRSSGNDSGKASAPSPIPAAHRRSPTGSAACPSSTTRSARTAAAPASRFAPPTRSRATEQGLALDMGRCLFCNDCVTACPEGAIQFSQDYRLATRARENLIVRSGQRAGAGQAAGAEDAPALRPLAQAPAGLAPAATPRPRPTSTSSAPSSSTWADSVSSSSPRPAMPTAWWSPARSRKTCGGPS